MSELDEKQKSRLLKLLEVVKEGDFALLKHFMNLEDSLEVKIGSIFETARQALAVAEETKKTEIIGPQGDRGEPGETIVGSVGPRGGRGETGQRGEQGERGESIVGPQGSQGERGATGENGSPDTPTQVKDKLLE